MKISDLFAIIKNNPLCNTKYPIHYQIFEHELFIGIDLSYFSFENCKFINCSFYNSNLNNTTIITTRFESCDFYKESVNKRKLYHAGNDFIRCDINPSAGDIQNILFAINNKFTKTADVMINNLNVGEFKP